MGTCVQQLLPSIPFGKLQADVSYSRQHIQQWMPHLLAQLTKPASQANPTVREFSWVWPSTKRNLQRTNCKQVQPRCCSVSATVLLFEKPYPRHIRLRQKTASPALQLLLLSFAKVQLPGLLWPKLPMHHSERLEPSGKYPRASVQTGGMTSP